MRFIISMCPLQYKKSVQNEIKIKGLKKVENVATQYFYGLHHEISLQKLFPLGVKTGIRKIFT